jgi:anthranilate phosphoribosyltransferase
MEQLGVRLDLPPDRLQAALDTVGIVFLFAPAMHQAMKYAMPARRELGMRTFFNLLGPLTNPAAAPAQVSGVYDRTALEKVAGALAELGLQRGFVVHGRDGLDEITTTEVTAIAEVRDGAVRLFTVTPEDFGVPRATLADLAGGDARHNATLIRELLGGAPGPRRDIVEVNSAAALVAAGAAGDWREGVALARRAIDTGAAMAKVEELARFR